MKDQTWTVNKRKMCCSQDAEEHRGGQCWPYQTTEKETSSQRKETPWQAGLWLHFPLTIGLRVTFAWSST